MVLRDIYKVESAVLGDDVHVRGIEGGVKDNCQVSSLFVVKTGVIYKEE
jgi:hypothetical protein